MKTALIMIITLLFLNGCGGDSSQESPTSPPSPSIGNSDIKPPSSPTIE